MCVRPSTGLYSRFSLDMGRSPGFGLAPADYHALLRLGFPPAPYLKYLTSPARAARRTVLQKVRGCGTIRSRRLSTRGFRFSFTPLPGSFSPFPHGTVLYRSLGSVQPWGVVPPTSRRVPRVPRYSGSCRAPHGFAYGVLTLSDRPSQAVPLSLRVTYAVRNPGAHALRFGLLRFRSPLLTESMFLSLPPPT